MDLFQIRKGVCQGCVLSPRLYNLYNLYAEYIMQNARLDEAQAEIKIEVKLLSHVRLFATPWTVAYQAPPSMEFSRQ